MDVIINRDRGVGMHDELTKALRCESVINDEHPRCESCKYGVVVCHGSREDVYGCDSRRIENDAADALEAADEKIADCVAAIDALDDSNDAYIKENERLKKRIAELEAQIPKEGEWIEVNKIKTYCSNCNWASYSMLVQKDAFILRNNKTKFCPNCGARMKR
jgi:hypothetical protein